MTNQKEKNCRVLFLFVHLHKGGMQRATSNISQALPDRFDQYIGYFGTENPGFVFCAKSHDFNLPPLAVSSLIGKITNAWRRIFALRSYIKEQQIDIVVSFGEAANIYNIGSWHGAKTIITSRVALTELMATQRYGTGYRMLVNLLYPFACKIVAVSEDLGEQMRRIVKGKVTVIVIPNLYHSKEIVSQSKTTLPPELLFLEKKRFILNVGSLCYQKGQSELLKVFSIVSERFQDLLLVILGRGQLKYELERQAESFGLAEKVIFVDFDCNPYRYMARASVFVLTSRYEGFPNVIVEAMLCGAPIVAFDCPTGPREILSAGRYGALILERSVPDAVEAISLLLKDESFHAKMSSLSLQRGEHFDAENVVDSWVALLQEHS